MKIICKEPLRVATLSGAVVLFEAGVPREVGEEIGKAALVMGADIVDAPVKVTKEPVAEVKSLIVVMEEIIEASNPTDFKADGTPKASIVNKYAGRSISTSEREAAWEQALNS